jgi:hypothetical protein
MLMAGTSFASVFMILFGAQSGLPLSLPPLPEDPVMARVAPADCIWYLNWSGAAEPNAKSSNQTEQLLAEPEVHEFVHNVAFALAKAIRKGAPHNPQGQVLGVEGPRLVYALVTHPAAAFVSKVGIGAGGLDVRAGVVVGTGDDTAKLKAALEKLEVTLLGPRTSAATATAANGNVSAWHKLPTARGAPPVEWGFRGKYLILGIGEGAADSISSSTNGQIPAWLAEIKKKLPVERISTMHYLNVQKVLTMIAPLVGVRGNLAIKAFGLDRIEILANVSGLDTVGCVSKTWLQISGDPKGMTALVGPEPLSAADLAPIPKDASLAIAVRMHVDRAWSAIVEAIGKIDPHTGEELSQGISQAESSLGFHFQEDLLQTLGDTWCIYNSPSEGGLVITGLTLVVPVKDHDRLVHTNDTLISTAGGSDSPGSGTSVSVSLSKFQKQTVYSLHWFTEAVWFVPSWCITDKQLILSLSPQNVRAFLSRDRAAGSLADLPPVAAKLKSGDTLMLSYQDTAATLKITYPVIQLFSNVFLSQMLGEGLDIDPSMLPSLASLVRHTMPTIATLSRAKDGYLYESHATLPFDVSVTGWLAASVGMFESIASPLSSDVEPPNK